MSGEILWHGGAAVMVPLLLAGLLAPAAAMPWDEAALTVCLPAMIGGEAPDLSGFQPLGNGIWSDNETRITLSRHDENQSRLSCIAEPVASPPIEQVLATVGRILDRADAALEAGEWVARDTGEQPKNGTIAGYRVLSGPCGAELTLLSMPFDGVNSVAVDQGDACLGVTKE